ncbi:MAG: hypothetical protein LBO07_07350 [Coriobacteriales bacterium]|jgi:hypothetical protein|nr:hypothetical protein [Coriobacteriales bacterium]
MFQFRLAQRSSRSFWFVEGDGGFSSVGVVVALMLTLALLFTSAQVYWVNSTAGDVQFAADAGALAAEDLVAEYYIIAQTADAVVLSLSLFGLLIYGIAIVVSCIPYCQEIGAKLMEFGQKVFKARDDCARQASKALNGLQKALPFLAAVNAVATIEANGFSREGASDYHGLAILVPWEGEELSFPDDAAVEAKAQEVGEQNEETAELSDEAEDARQRMEQAKLEAYLADCGSNPNYCMYERAGHLAHLSGAQNPFFSSVETWQFDYALARAQAYYRQRAATEGPANTSLEEQVRSHIRSQYYHYAIEEMQRGYSHTSADGIYQGFFPLLARNTAEIRQTRLYTDAVYPVDANGVLHGVTSCSVYQEAGAAGWGSISQLESGLYTSCELCGLSASSIGRVASASTSIENGFEYHYRIVAAAAERYETASRDFADATGAAQESAEDAFDSFEEAFAALETPRIHPKPPGRNGCIAIAFDLSARLMPDAFGSSFVSGDAALPPRMAISAAALALDEASEGNTVLAAFLDRAKENSEGSAWGSGLGIFDGILGIWGDTLLAYSEGVEGLCRGVGDVLRAIPLVNATPLASWAEETLRSAIRGVGLEGVALGAPKPVIVNSIHVIRAGDNQALAALGTVKEAYGSLPGTGAGDFTTDVLDGVLAEVQRPGTGVLEREVRLFTISLGDWPGAPSIPVTIRLPEQVAR